MTREGYMPSLFLHIQEVKNIEVNKIFNEDCLEGMKRIPDKSIDMILCDLPYGTTACKWDTVIPLDLLWKHYMRIIKNNGAIVLTASQPFTTKLINSNINVFKYNMIWEKPQAVDPFMSKIRPLNNIEDIIVFGEGRIGYHPQYSKGDPYVVTRDKKERDYEITKTKMKETKTINDGKRLPKRVVKFNQQRGLHPTQKPVPLFEYLIKTHTNEGETVLDNCIGSGTTAIACINSNRSFIGFEMDKDYFDIATKRIEGHSMILT